MKIGILWDLDGTLLDTLEDLMDGVNYALDQFGLPPRTLEEIRRFVGNGAANQIRKSLPEGTDEEFTFKATGNRFIPYCAEGYTFKIV